MLGQYQEVNLENLNSGAISDLFENELEKMLANIADPNTKAETMREITIKIKVKPNESRESAVTQITVTDKYAPIKPHEGFINAPIHLLIGAQQSSKSKAAQSYCKLVRNVAMVEDELAAKEVLKRWRGKEAHNE